jgi:hypothetical protein
VEELFCSLNIEGDIDGFVLGKSEVEYLKEGTKWLAAMRLLDPKPFNVVSLKKMMMFAWAPSYEVTLCGIDIRLLVHTNCLGDWKRVTEHGSWIFSRPWFTP